MGSAHLKIRWLSKFRHAKSGNVAIIFGLALLPILGFAGAAVDYSRASNMRAKMQVAADAAALSGDLVSPWSEGQCISVARQRLESGMAENAIVPASDPTIQCSPAGTQVFVETEVPTVILSALLTNYVDVSVVAHTRCTVPQGPPSATGSDIMAYMPFHREPNEIDVNTMGEHGHIDIHGNESTNPTFAITPDGWPIIRLENPHNGPTEIIVEQFSGPQAERRFHTYEVPGRGFWLTTWPYINVLDNPRTFVFRIEGSPKTRTHSNNYRFINLDNAPSSPQDQIASASGNRSCYISR